MGWFLPRLILLSIAVCIGGCPHVVRAQGVVSRSPFDPTIEDCRALAARNSSLIQELYRRLNTCQSGPVNFGQAPTCGGGQRLYAWVQCAPLYIHQCQTERNVATENRTCQERAGERARHADEESRRARAIEDERALAERISAVNSATRDARSAIDLVSDPRILFQRALNQQSRDFLRIFTEKDQQLRPEGKELGQAVFDFAFRNARDGLRAVPSNSIVRTIQADSLARIESYMRSALDQLDVSLHQLQWSSNNLRFPLTARVTATAPALAASQPLPPRSTTPAETAPRSQPTQSARPSDPSPRSLPQQSAAPAERAPITPPTQHQPRNTSRAPGPRCAIIQGYQRCCNPGIIETRPVPPGWSQGWSCRTN